VGGTGKTPVVESIIKLCLQRSLKPCVISRNYKAQSLGVQKVDLKRAAAALYYGDEPVQIAQKFPDVSVWTGPRKYLTAIEAEQDEDCDLFIIDDGFQHQALHRDFDIVLIDATSNEIDDQLIPSGRLREDFSALKRAQMIFLTKINWAKSTRILELQNKLPSDVPMIEVEFQSQFKQPITKGGRYLLVSGIANPHVFASQAENMMNSVDAEIVDHLIFADHCPYTDSDLKKIESYISQNNVDAILTTEKDFTKLQDIAFLKNKINYICVTAQFSQPPKGLYEFLDQIAR
jgi:tetraacyldisaccharide 4'-kinase